MVDDHVNPELKGLTDDILDIPRNGAMAYSSRRGRALQMFEPADP